MRKRNVKVELKEYPCYEFKNGRLERIPPPLSWNGLHLHHYITTQWQQNNPEKFEEVRHLQKLIFLPPQMHMELHAKYSKFKEKYGIEIKELLFDRSEYMKITAATARVESELNSIKKKIEHIEKLIKKEIEKGQNHAFISGQIPQEVIDEVKEGGFDVEIQPTGMRIMW